MRAAVGQGTIASVGRGTSTLLVVVHGLKPPRLALIRVHEGWIVEVLGPVAGGGDGRCSGGGATHRRLSTAQGRRRIGRERVEVRGRRAHDEGELIGRGGEGVPVGGGEGAQVGRDVEHRGGEGEPELLFLVHLGDGARGDGAVVGGGGEVVGGGGSKAGGARRGRVAWREREGGQGGRRERGAGRRLEGLAESRDCRRREGGGGGGRRIIGAVAHARGRHRGVGVGGWLSGGVAGALLVELSEEHLLLAEGVVRGLREAGGDRRLDLVLARGGLPGDEARLHRGHQLGLLARVGLRLSGRGGRLRRLRRRLSCTSHQHAAELLVLVVVLVAHGVDDPERLEAAARGHADGGRGRRPAWLPERGGSRGRGAPGRGAS